MPIRPVVFRLKIMSIEIQQIGVASELCQSKIRNLDVLMIGGEHHRSAAALDAVGDTAARMIEAVRGDTRLADSELFARHDRAKLANAAHLGVVCRHVNSRQPGFLAKHRFETIEHRLRRPQGKMIGRIIERLDERNGGDVIDMGMRQEDVSRAAAPVFGSIPSLNQFAAKIAKPAAAIQNQQLLGRLHLDARAIAAVGRAQIKWQIGFEVAANRRQVRSTGDQFAQSPFVDQMLDRRRQLVGDVRRAQAASESAGRAPIADSQLWSVVHGMSQCDGVSLPRPDHTQHNSSRAAAGKLRR